MTGRYKIKTVAERSGFSATLLRAWERRYAFLEPERLESGHRLYTEEDMKVLKAVKLLLDRGQSVGEVAALGREALLRFEVSSPLEEALETTRPSWTELEQDLLPAKEDLLQAAAALDYGKSRAIVERLSRELEPGKLREFALDISHEVGLLWAGGKMTVASEHLLSGLWTEQLHILIQRLDEPDPDGKVVICAGFPDEFHEVGLLFLHYELRKAGHRVVYLGPALPFEDLDSSIRRLRPHFVCLSVARTAVLQVHLPRFTDTVERHPSVTFVVGGAGVAGAVQEVNGAGAISWTAGESLAEGVERMFS